MTQLTWAAITPVRDEARHLERLAGELEAQTVPPLAWVVVDNGSADGSAEIGLRLAAERPWVRTVATPPSATAMPGAPIVRAFHAGLTALQSTPDVIVKLDADVGLERRYAERLLASFASRPRLGLAGGVCFEPGGGGWVPVTVTAGHVRGAVRAYRTACLAELLPLPERMGWDTVDEVAAELAGWEVATPDDLAFLHHRPLGARDGSPTARWRAQGEGAYYLGYRPSYLLLRALHHARRDPAALAMASAYLRQALGRSDRHPDPAVRDRIRAAQSLRAARRRAAPCLPDPRREAIEGAVTPSAPPPGGGSRHPTRCRRTASPGRTRAACAAPATRASRACACARSHGTPRRRAGAPPS